MRARSLLLAVLLVAPALSQAFEAAEAEKLRDAIERFKQSEEAAFAPQSIARAEAFLGAAMLAHEQHKDADADAALAKAEQTLNEARHVADSFRRDHAEVLKLARAARESLEVLKREGEEFTGGENPAIAINRGDASVHDAVTAMEAGRLGESQNRAMEAGKAYRQALDILMPPLASRSARLISRASSAGAKRYAPQTLNAARESLAPVRAYADGLSEAIPEHPANALKLARQAMDLARKIKELKKKPDSYEKLILQARRLRLHLAESLGREVRLPINPADPTADIDEAELVRAADELVRRLHEERRQHQAELDRLKQQHQRELEARLSEQQRRFLEARNEELAQMKEAFRAKLERETFEKKRQAKVARLFKPGEASILANLDGSLVIRLSGLHFAPNKSSIEAKYRDLLQRLSQALEVYADRKVRIEGHTDNQGDVKFNQKLSLRRAEAVRDFLVKAGIDPSRLTALGYGEVRPIASNEFARGREMNRRIDIVIAAPEKRGHE